MFERRIIMKIEERLLSQLPKPLCECSNQEIYDALLTMVQDMAKEKEYKVLQDTLNEIKDDEKVFD